MSILTFEALPGDLTRTSSRIKLLTGNILFTEGSAADSLFFVETGCVRLVVHPHDGKQLVLHRARDGELFAEDHLVRSTYSFTAIADKRTVLRSVDRNSLLNYITKNTAGLMLYLQSASDRYNQLRMNYERLGLPSAKAKVLQMLVTMTDGGKRTIDLTGRFKTLAADLNLTHETMYRALTALEQQDAIHRNDGLVSIVQHPD